MNLHKAYTKSKVLAEKAAWDFVKDRESKNQPCFELTTVNPGFVMVEYQSYKISLSFLESINSFQNEFKGSSITRFALHINGSNKQVNEPRNANVT